MLRVGVCGEVVVEVDGRRLPESLFAGRQGRLVFAYLVCERQRSVRREELAELLWGDAPPSSWPASLSAVISKLRKMLTEAGLDGTEALAAAFGSYRLHLPDDTEVDWERLLTATDAAEERVRLGDNPGAIAAATEAQAIARRGFHTDDAVWVDAQGDRLHDLHVRAAVAQTEAYLAAGERARAVAAAREALAVDELRESSHRLLMRALATAGERGEALRVWEHCRTLLVEELGIDPSPETEAVYLSILNDAAAPVATTPAPTPSLPTGVVTFLLTDIVDSSGLWERDSAGMAAALERHDALAADTVGAHGGTLLKAKLEGDATVSVFRRASEAVFAALALRDALAHEPWPAGVAPDVRMGIHTGEALERNGDYFGPALNRAARLRGLASGGQILVSQAVAEVVSDHLPDGTALRSLGEYQLRGLSRVEHVFEVTMGDVADHEPDAPVARPAMPNALAGAGPFVGRGTELDRLAADWATVTDGAVTALFISGEPGVGKTRLASEWARRRYEEGAIVLYGRCDEDLGAPYQPFAEAVRALLPAIPASRLRTVRGVEELARLVPELAQILPSLPAPTQADHDTERYLLFDALSRLLATVSAETPIVLVVDDLHWAAKPTLLLLRHALRFGEGARVQIVSTYRSTDLDRTHPLAAALVDLQRDSAVQRIALGGLDDTDVSAYLAESGYDDENMGAALTEVTAGNPFFLIEVLRHVDETGGHWDPSTLPQGVREAVTRRLSRLPEVANEALLAGAVAGSRFSLALIERVLERDLIDEIDESRRAGIIVEEAGGLFRFNHALVRQSLLAEVASVKRVRLHQKIAAALEESAPVDRDAHLADLARHWFECAWAGGAAKAVDYCRQAAEQAMARLAYEEAADFFDRAAQAAEIDGGAERAGERAELLIARCEALFAAGDIGSAGAAVAQLRDASNSIPSLAPWAMCFAAELEILVHPETLADTEQLVVAAAAQFAEAGDDAGEAKAHTVRARCLARLGRIADCEAALDKALTAGRRADDPKRVNAVLAGAPLAALWGPSPVARASGRCLDVVRVLRITTGSPVVEATALRCQAVLEALRGRTDAARRMLGSARRSLESLAHAYGLLELDLFAGVVELYAGEPEAAVVTLQRARQGFVERGIGVDSAHAGALLARAFLAQDRVDEALELTTEAEGLAGVDLQAAIAWRSARAEALARRGDIDEAMAAARAAVDLADVTDALIFQADAHAALAAVLRAAGRAGEADREARQAADLYERKGATARVEAVRAIGVAAQPTSATSPPVQRRLRPNLATDVELGAVTDETIETMSHLLADDLVSIDHRMQLTVGKREILETFRTMSVGRGPRLDVSYLATLGSRHALLRATWRTSDSRHEVSFIETVSTNRDGLVVRFEQFPNEDLNDAIARLIELHADDELPPEVREARYRLADAYRRLRIEWADDAVVVDHRPASLGELRGRDAIGVADAALGVAMRWRVRDLLGFDQSASACVIESSGVDAEGGAVEMAMLTVNEFDHAGQLTHSDWYAPADVEAALARFDALTGAGAAVERRVRPNLITAAMTEGEFDPSVAAERSTRYSPDFVSIDHRMHIERDRDGTGADLRVTAEGGGRLLRTPLATLGERHALSRCEWRSGHAQHLTAWVQVEVADPEGRPARFEMFEPTDLAHAVARLVESHAENELAPGQRDARYALAAEARQQHEPLMWFDSILEAGSERRVRENQATALVRAAWGGDYSEHDELFADDIVIVDHRIQLTIGRAQYLDTLRLGAEAGGTLAVEVLASLGERHGLIRSTWQRDGAAVASVIAVRSNGAGQLVRLESFQPDELHDALARVIELHAEEELPPERQPGRATVAAFRRGGEFRWRDDAVLVDHRIAGLGTVVGHDALREVARALRSATSDLRRSTVDVLALTEHHDLLEIVTSGTTESGDPFDIHLLALGQYGDDGLIDRGEWFEVDQRDEAFARLDELSSPRAAPPSPRRVRTNVASEVVLAAQGGDYANRRALYAEDFVCVDHRVRLTLDRSAYLETLQLGAGIGGSISTELLASLGQRHALSRNVWHTADATIEAIGVWRCNADGLLALGESFGADQLQEALARLVELHADDELPPEEHAARYLIAAQNRTATHRWSADAVVHDHRPSSLGVLHGREEIARAGAALRNVGIERRRTVDVLGFTGTAGLLHGVSDSDDGAELHVLSVFDLADDGLVRRADWYTPEQLDDALARFDELTAPPAPRRHRFRPNAASAAAADAEVIATLGDRHGLVRRGDGYLVVRADGDVLVDVEAFRRDELNLAIARHYETFAEDELPPEARDRLYRVAAQPRGLFTEWADDGVLEDRRPGGLGLVEGAAAIRAAGSALRELGSGFRRTITDLLAVDQVSSLLEVVNEGRDNDGGPFEISLLALTILDDDGRCRRQEWFGLEQADEALARVEELVSPAVVERVAALGSYTLVSTGTAIELRRRESRLETFGTHDLNLAFAALIEAHADTDLPAERRAGRRRHAAWLRAVTYDWAEDVVLVDHRPAGLGRLDGRQAIRDAARALRELGAGFRRHITEVLAFSLDLSLLEVVSKGTTADGAPVEIPVLVISDVDHDGLTRHSEWFAPEQREEALARFRELTAARPIPVPSYLENSAYLYGLALDAAIVAGDWDTVRSRMYATTVIDDRRTGVHVRVDTPGDVMAYMESLGGAGVTRLTRTPLASRGDTLVLQRYLAGGNAGEVETLMLIEVTADRLVAAVIFDSDDFDAAYAELDRRYLAVLPEDEARVARSGFEQGDAYNRRDWEAFGRYCAEDFQAVDHRTMQPRGSQGRQAWLDSTRALDELVSEDRGRVAAVLGVTSQAWAIVYHHWGLREGGEFERDYILVDKDEAGVRTRRDYFDVDDLDAAMARFAEVAAESDAIPAYLDTFAHRQRKRLSDVILHNVAALAPEVAEDCVIEDRRSLVGGMTAVGRHDVVEFWKGVVAVGVDAISFVPVASRGQRLGVHRSTFAGPDAETVAIGVDEIDEGGWRRAYALDADHLDAAYDLLDQWYLESDAAPFAAMWSPVMKFTRAYNERDWDSWARLLDADRACIDHRAAGWGALDRDAFTATVRGLIDLVADIKLRVLAVPRLDTASAAVVFRAEGSDANGGQFELEWLGVAATHDGRLRWEFYEVDADPSPRFDEPVDTPRPTFVPDNTAARLRARQAALYEKHDWQGLADGVARDVEYADHRSIVGGLRAHGRERFLELVRSTAAVGVARLSLETLATRGERLVLHRVVYAGASAESESLQLSAFDAAGHLVLYANFDEGDVDAAFAELDARYLAAEAGHGAAAFSTGLELIGTYTARDWVRCRSMLTDDFTLTDHRSLFGTIDADEYVEVLRALFDDLSSDAHSRIISVDRLSPSALVAVVRIAGTTADGGEFETGAALFGRLRDGRVASLEFWHPDERDAAVARFDELADVSRPAQPRYVPENAATRHNATVSDLFAARDWEAYAAELADDVVFVDRRPLVGGLTHVGRANVVSMMRGVAGVGVSELLNDTLATRGENLVLVHTIGHGPTAETDTLIVSEHVDGRLTYCAILDPADADAAYDELDARYRAGEGAPFAEIWDLGIEYIRSFTTFDFSILRTRFADDFVYRDRRPGSVIGTQTLQEFIEATETIPEFTGGITVRIVEVCRISPTVIIGVAYSEGQSDNGGLFDYEMVFIARTRDGLISSFDILAVEERDAVVAEFDEQLARSSRYVPDNAAARLAKQVTEDFLTQGWSAFSPTLADGVTFDDRRPLIGGMTFEGRAPVMDAVQAGDDEITDFTFLVVATRGESLVLGRAVIDRAGVGIDTAGEVEVLYLSEWRNGKTVAFVVFAADDVDAAYDELDARYMAGEGAEYADTWSIAVRYLRAFKQADVGRLQLAAAVRVRILEVVSIRTDACVGVTRWEGLNEGGGSVGDEMAFLARIGDGRVVSFDVYDVGDLGVALARFDETTVMRLTRLLDEALMSQDWDGWRALATEDIMHVDVRVGVGGEYRGRETVLAEIGDISLAIQDIRSDVVASRGDSLVVEHKYATGEGPAGGDIEAEILLVAQAEPAVDRVGWTAWHDPTDLSGAVTALDERYLASLPDELADAWRVAVDLTDRYNRREGLFDLLATDCVIVDDRMGAGEVTADELARGLGELLEMVADAFLYCDRVDRLANSGSAGHYRVVGTIPDGGDFELSFNITMAVRDGRITRLELLPDAS